MKKVIITVSILLILIGLGILIYLVFFAPDDPEARERRIGFFNFGQDDPDFDDIRDPNNRVDNDRGLTENETTRRSGGLWRVSPAPSSYGSVIPFLNQDEELMVRLVARERGDVYEVNVRQPGDNSILAQPQDLPPVYKSHWLSPETAILRFIENDTLETLIITSINESGSESTLYLPSNINRFVAGSDQMFYLNNGSGLIQGSPQGQARLVFNSNLTQWLLSWPAPSTVALTQAPAGGERGFLVWLNTQTGQQRIVLDDVVGLTTLTNSDLNYTLYSSGDLNSLSSFIFDHHNQTETRLTVDTIVSDKCVWSRSESHIAYCAVPTALPEALYPDHWYQGRVSFSDQIWRINANTGQSQRMGQDLLPAMDASHLSLSPEEDVLFFMNRQDSHLWALDLNN